MDLLSLSGYKMDNITQNCDLLDLCITKLENTRFFGFSRWGTPTSFMEFFLSQKMAASVPFSYMRTPIYAAVSFDVSALLLLKVVSYFPFYVSD